VNTPVVYRLARRPDRGRVWYITWTENGVTRRRTTKTANKAAAQKVLASFLEDRAAEDDGQRLELTLRQAADEWMAEKASARHGLAPQTLAGYRTSLSRFVASQPRRRLLRDVRPAHIIRHLEQRQAAGAAPTTLRHALTHISMLFRWHCRMGHAGRNPAEAVEAPRGKPTPVGEIGEREFWRLHAAALADIDGALTDSGRRTREAVAALLELLWWTGLRSIEAIRLRWDDVDLERAVMVVRSPEKKGGVRAVPLHPKAVAVLARRRLLGGDGPFPAPAAMKTAWRRFKARKANAEWRGVNLHAIRHSFVTRLSRLGDQAAASLLVGHHSREMTRHYTHLTPEDARAALERLG